MCEPQFVVKDQDGNVALRIEGPFCTYSICGDVEFKVLSPDGSTEVGKISKKLLDNICHQVILKTKLNLFKN